MINLDSRFALLGAMCCMVLARSGALADPPAAPNYGPVCISPSKTAASQSGKSALLDAHGIGATDLPTVASRAAAPDRGEQMVRTALTYRGSPYRHGGVSPKSGFDCSGFVQTMCGKFGIYLPRAARQQFSASVGKRVLPSELKSGDLVFFSDTYRHGTSHVGIYIGDGKIIHAATPAQGVVVSELTEEYLRKHYCGAIRIDLNKLPTVPGSKNEGSMAGAAITCGRQDLTAKPLKIAPLGLQVP